MLHYERLTKKIQQLLANIIAYELSDPRIKFASVTKIKLSKDYKYCKVYISILGSRGKKNACMNGLMHARGHIQSKLASRLATRQTPIIEFVYDDSIEKSIAISKLIDEVVSPCPDDEQPGATSADLSES